MVLRDCLIVDLIDLVISDQIKGHKKRLLLITHSLLSILIVPTGTLHIPSLPSTQGRIIAMTFSSQSSATYLDVFFSLYFTKYSLKDIDFHTGS